MNSDSAPGNGDYSEKPLLDALEEIRMEKEAQMRGDRPMPPNRNSDSAPLTTPLLELADRCEREEPSWGLDKDIRKVINAPKIGYLWHYTTSLDAAVTLLPVDFSYWDANVEPAGGARPRVTITFNDDREVTSEARTLALSLCAAALRALASMKDEKP